MKGIKLLSIKLLVSAIIILSNENVKSLIVKEQEPQEVIKIVKSKKVKSQIETQESQEIEIVKTEDCIHLENAVNLFGNDLRDRFYSQNVTDCCNFDEISCDTIEGESHIVSIKFDNHKSFDGKETEAITELTNLNYLTTIEMNNFMFSSSFPKSFGDFKKLENLILTHNVFVSEIPEELGNLSTLVKLDLSNNYLTGQIPASFANLKNLKSINLNHNRLEGPIPYNFKFLSNLEEFKLNENISLRGYVPLMPKINTCDYNLTGLCNLKSAKCKTAYSGCTKEDISNTNKENGNPNPNSNEYDNEEDISTKKKLITNSSSTTMILLSTVILIVVVIALCFCCGNCRKIRAAKEKSRYKSSSNYNTLSS